MVLEESKKRAETDPENGGKTKQSYVKKTCNTRAIVLIKRNGEKKHIGLSKSFVQRFGISTSSNDCSSGERRVKENMAGGMWHGREF